MQVFIGPLLLDLLQLFLQGLLALRGSFPALCIRPGIQNRRLPQSVDDVGFLICSFLMRFGNIFELLIDS